MRYVKIKDTYFNPMRIDRIEPDVDFTSGFHKPVVRVHTPGWMFTYDAFDLGFDVPRCDEKWEALGIADAMVENVIKELELSLAQ